MSVLKWDKDFALEQAADDAELLEELLGIFKDSFQSDLQLIEEGLGGDDAAKVAGAAHSIKGAAASLGIQGVNEVAMGIEHDSREGNLEVARENLDMLHKMMDELKSL